MCDYIQINRKDNVAVAMRDLSKGELICGVTLADDIPVGHKFSLRNIEKGEDVVKYSFAIGRAKENIPAGAWVHTHNLESKLDEKRSYSYNYVGEANEKLPDEYFYGYDHGYDIGIRKDIYIIPTVGCVNNICHEIAERARSVNDDAADGIYVLSHQFGCSQLGDDSENIKKILGNLALNGNACGVLIVGLGCENNSLEGIEGYLSPFHRKNIIYLKCQSVGDEVNEGFEAVKKLLRIAGELKRSKIPFSRLKVGLKCGGSDAFSGITANPLVGRFCDRLVSLGGSCVLTEVPEMFGAEHILMGKCANDDVFRRYSAMIEKFKDYYIKNGFPVYENPSPGNRAGGITTLEEKSLGCVEKAGSSDICDVLDYTDRINTHGVSVMNGPGNDLIAATALAAAGCHMILFTTGRGTPFTSAVPTLKIASNHNLAENKSGWIDHDASRGGVDELFEKVRSIASGERKCRFENRREIAFFKTGVTL